MRLSWACCLSLSNASCREGHSEKPAATIHPVYGCARARLACFFWRAVTRGPGALNASHNSRLRFRRRIFFLRKRPNLDLSPLRSDKAIAPFSARLPLLRCTGPLAGRISLSMASMASLPGWVCAKLTTSSASLGVPWCRCPHGKVGSFTDAGISGWNRTRFRECPNIVARGTTHDEHQICCESEPRR
jgi:hypothetical protein